jgi:hypothetical protein
MTGLHYCVTMDKNFQVGPNTTENGMTGLHYCGLTFFADQALSALMVSLVVVPSSKSDASSMPKQGSSLVRASRYLELNTTAVKTCVQRPQLGPEKVVV